MYTYTHYNYLYISTAVHYLPHYYKSSTRDKHTTVKHQNNDIITNYHNYQSSQTSFHYSKTYTKTLLYTYLKNKLILL